VHYLQDLERGVVWEESIIMTGGTMKSARFVLLSATLPNADKFAQWISLLHNQPCHVLITHSRPVPLEHYVMPAGASGLYLAKSSDGVFHERNMEAAIAEFRRPGRKSSSSTVDLLRVISRCVGDGLAPAIVFAFARRECEASAAACARKFKDGLLSAEEQVSVAQLFDAALATLDECDRQLPQVTGLLPLLQKGIAVHHSGMLPILREAVELLFQEGHVRVLFATETFSLGLNMPARCCIFSSARKFDGHVTRWVSSGEYIQMSGRAGRRGIDDKGIVIVMLEEELDPQQAQQIMSGIADPMSSTFKVSYNLVLNATRSTSTNPEAIVMQSFFSYLQSEEAGCSSADTAAELQSAAACIHVKDEPLLAELAVLEERMAAAQSAHSLVVSAPDVALPFLVPGRVVALCGDWGHGIVLAWHKRTRPDGRRSLPLVQEAERWVCDVLVFVAQDSTAAPGSSAAALHSPSPGWNSASNPTLVNAVVLPFLLSCVRRLCAVSLPLPPLISSGSEASALKMMFKVKGMVEGAGGQLPDVDLTPALCDKDHEARVSFFRNQEHMQNLQRCIFQHAAVPLRSLDTENFDKWTEKRRLLERSRNVALGQLDHAVVRFSKELRLRRRVLKHLDYMEAMGGLTTKGVAACELSSCEDLVLVEALFCGAFVSLEPSDCAALASLVVAEEKFSSSCTVVTRLRPQLEIFERAMQTIVAAERELGVVGRGVAEQNVSFVDIAAAWASGASFASVMEMTDKFEGSVVRGLRRLGEVLLQLTDAMHAVGDVELKAIFEKVCLFVCGVG
jgi:ATP-dependent RNA helicase DOB1